MLSKRQRLLICFIILLCGTFALFFSSCRIVPEMIIDDFSITLDKYYVTGTTSESINVKIKYTDGTEENKTLADATVEGLDLNKEGEYNVNVTFGDVTHTYKFIVKNKYTVIHTAGEGGKVALLSDNVPKASVSQTVISGSSSNEVVAIPDENYEFVAWSDSSVNVKHSISSVSSDTEITATFKKIGFEVKIFQWNNSFDFSVKSSSEYNPIGSTITLNPIEKNGYKFEGFVTDKSKAGLVNVIPNDIITSDESMPINKAIEFYPVYTNIVRTLTFISYDDTVLLTKKFNNFSQVNINSEAKNAELGVAMDTNIYDYYWTYDSNKLNVTFDNYEIVNDMTIKFERVYQDRTMTYKYYDPSTLLLTQKIITVKYADTVDVYQAFFDNVGNLNYPGKTYVFKIYEIVYDNIDDSSINITIDVEVEMVLTDDIYTVKYINSISGETINSVGNLKYNDTFTLPNTAVYEGYVFKNWSVKSSGGDYQKIDSNYVVKGDATIYATYFVAVNYEVLQGDTLKAVYKNSNGDDTDYTLNGATLYVDYGTSMDSNYILEMYLLISGVFTPAKVVMMPATYNGYIFEGWYTDKYTTRYTVSDAITSSITLYAKQEIERFNVNVSCEYGSIYLSCSHTVSSYTKYDNNVYAHVCSVSDCNALRIEDGVLSVKKNVLIKVVYNLPVEMQLDHLYINSYDTIGFVGDATYNYKNELMSDGTRKISFQFSVDEQSYVTLVSGVKTMPIIVEASNYDKIITFTNSLYSSATLNDKSLSFGASGTFVSKQYHQAIITLYAKSGYKITSITINGTNYNVGSHELMYDLQDEKYYITIDSLDDDISIGVTATVRTHDITVNSSANGIYSIYKQESSGLSSDDGKSVPYLNTRSIVFTANNNYKLVRVEINGEICYYNGVKYSTSKYGWSDNELKLNIGAVDRDYIVMPIYAPTKIEFSVKIINGNIDGLYIAGNRIGAASGENSYAMENGVVQYGDSLSVTYTPNDGYEVSALTVNNVSVSELPSSITDHTIIVVTMKEIEYTLSMNVSGAGGTFDVYKNNLSIENNTTNYNYIYKYSAASSVIKLLLHPYEGYEIDSVKTLDGNDLTIFTSDGVLYVEYGTQRTNETIIVFYKIITYNVTVGLSTANALNYVTIDDLDSRNVAEENGVRTIVYSADYNTSATVKLNLGEFGAEVTQIKIGTVVYYKSNEIATVFVGNEYTFANIKQDCDIFIHVEYKEYQVTQYDTAATIIQYLDTTNEYVDVTSGNYASGTCMRLVITPNLHYYINELKIYNTTIDSTNIIESNGVYYYDFDLTNSLAPSDIIISTGVKQYTVTITNNRVNDNVVATVNSVEDLTQTQTKSAGSQFDFDLLVKNEYLPYYNPIVKVGNSVLTLDSSGRYTLSSVECDTNIVITYELIQYTINLDIVDNTDGSAIYVGSENIAKTLASQKYSVNLNAGSEFVLSLGNSNSKTVYVTINDGINIWDACNEIVVANKAISGLYGDVNYFKPLINNLTITIRYYN